MIVRRKQGWGTQDKGPGVNSNSRNYFYRVNYPEGDRKVYVYNKD
jgi:hypothetical protein